VCLCEYSRFTPALGFWFGFCAVAALLRRPCLGLSLSLRPFVRLPQPPRGAALSLLLNSLFLSVCHHTPAHPVQRPRCLTLLAWFVAFRFGLSCVDLFLLENSLRFDVPVKCSRLYLTSLSVWSPDWVLDLHLLDHFSPSLTCV
jgi:hypothetical protein